MRLLGWALIQSDWCPYKKRRLGHTEKDTRNMDPQRKGHMKTQREDHVRTQ